MTRDVILTCAVNGGSPTAQDSNPGLPVTSAEIAAAIAEAAEGGAAIAHFHVRDPQTGLPSNDPALYREVVERVRNAGTAIHLNMTCSMDGMLYLDDRHLPAAETTLRPVAERCAHALSLRPAIATIDCGTFAVGEAIHVARPCDLAEQARLLREAGVKPEVECFDLGHVETARRLVADGALAHPPFLQLCLGTAYGGAPATPEAFAAMRARIPEGAAWAAFAAGQDNLWVMERAIAEGGHVRVGLEDTPFRGDGTPESNAALLAGARAMVERAGHKLASPEVAAATLGL